MDILRYVPLGIYLESPVTWLHQLDARVKLAWLLSILLSPVLAAGAWRLGIVAFLIGLTVTAGLPLRVWVRQIGLVLALALLTAGATAIAPEALGVAPAPQRQGTDVAAYGLLSAASETVTSESARAEEIAELRAYDWSEFGREQSYQYIVVQAPFGLLGRAPIQISRRTLTLGIRLGTLIFTLLYSSTLFLLVTAPEELAESLAVMGRPLQRWGVPVSELVLTLTLALRFLPLVLEEVQNLIRAIRTRDIRWQALGLRGSAGVVLGAIERLLANLLLRAEQTAAAMQVRGYEGPERLVAWHVFRLRRRDLLVLGLLPLFWLCRITLA
ncbi:MAG: CbiQ family ECF transporter T component [Cyanobacteria bacterium J06642_2]